MEGTTEICSASLCCDCCCRFRYPLHRHNQATAAAAVLVEQIGVVEYVEGAGVSVAW